MQGTCQERKTGPRSADSHSCRVGIRFRALQQMDFDQNLRAVDLRTYLQRVTEKVSTASIMMTNSVIFSKRP